MIIMCCTHEGFLYSPIGIPLGLLYMRPSGNTLQSNVLSDTETEVECKVLVRYSLHPLPSEEGTETVSNILLSTMVGFTVTA